MEIKFQIPLWKTRHKVSQHMPTDCHNSLQRTVAAESIGFEM